MGQPQPLFSFILSFQTNITIFTANKCEKSLSSIWHWDSNPQPLEHESPPLTTRPELPRTWLIIILYLVLKVFSSCDELQTRIHPATAKPAKTDVRACQSRQPGGRGSQPRPTANVTKLHFKHVVHAASVPGNVAGTKVNHLFIKLMASVVVLLR